MKNYFKKKYLLSDEGASNLVKATLTRFLTNVTIMFPMMLAFTFLQQGVFTLLGKTPMIDLHLYEYAIISVVIFFIMFFTSKLDYKYCYTTVYDESAKSRIKLAETLRQIPLSYFGKKDIADLSATIMTDATTLEHMFSHAVPHIYGAALSTTLIIIMFAFFNWKMALALFWVLPVALLVFQISRKFQKRVHNERFYHEREIIDYMQDGFDQMQEIKSYNQEEKIITEMRQKFDILHTMKIKGELVVGSLVNISFIILKLAMASVILIGAYLFAKNIIDVFTYIVFITVSGSIYGPIMSVLMNLAELLALDASVKRITEIDTMPLQTGAKELSPKNYDIEFKSVNFSYEEGVQTLQDVSFVAKQGEVTALVGPSGGGKTTATKCAARFWDINSGTITLGGIDISTIEPEELLKNYSIVFQDVSLFNSSVMENIRLGRENATDEEVKQVAKLARCEDFIAKLPKGYETLIGENGEKLSGGERQRISIARALLKNAPIILLDEATASLDAENETQIQQAISELIKNKTVIIIAHRMRTVIDADKIVVLKDGKIAEVGNSKELIAKNGIFAKMYNAQM